MNLYGRYNIYRDGELVFQSPNLITENGKSIILQYLAGTITNWASFIGVGALSTTAATSDSKLYYEITRFPIETANGRDSSSYTVTASGTANTSSITVSSSVGLAMGYSALGGGLSSSVTSTITSVSGTRVNLSYPVETTFSGSTVSFKTPKSVRFSTRMPAGIACQIYELGLFNSSKLINQGQVDNQILTNFDEGVSTVGWSGGTSSSAVGASYTPRVGEFMLRLTPVSGTPASAVLGEAATSPVAIGASTSNYGDLAIDTTGFSSSYDKAKILVYASGAGASITVLGQDDTTGLTTNTITLIPKTAVASGGPTLIESTISKGSTYNNNLSKIQISASSSASVDLYFDSLKLSKTEDLSIYTGMVSRSALSSPITKASAETIDIEYEIFLFP